MPRLPPALVLSGEATVTPEAQDGPVEALCQLRVARAGAMKARTTAANQLHSLCDTAPDPVRAQLTGRGLRSVARRWRALDNEARTLRADIHSILNDIAPALLAVHGVGDHTAGQLLVTAGDNPDRLGHEKSFAAFCGSTPVKASSGRTRRHRLNRGGDRQANSALRTIVRTRMANHPATITTSNDEPPKASPNETSCAARNSNHDGQEHGRVNEGRDSIPIGGFRGQGRHDDQHHRPPGSDRRRP